MPVVTIAERPNRSGCKFSKLIYFKAIGTGASSKRAVGQLSVGAWLGTTLRTMPTTGRKSVITIRIATIAVSIFN